MAPGDIRLFHRGGGFQELGNGQGLVLYYASSAAGSIPPDTLTVSGDAATLHIRQGASGATFSGWAGSLAPR